MQFLTVTLIGATVNCKFIGNKTQQVKTVNTNEHSVRPYPDAIQT